MSHWHLEITRDAAKTLSKIDHRIIYRIEDDHLVIVDLGHRREIHNR